MRLLFFFIFSQMICSQGYTEYLTGSIDDVVTTPLSGVCLMGGAIENDEAMKWFLNRANGGDVVVLRSSGSDGYNNYFYSDLGITINSVRTFVITNVSGAIDPYILDKVEKAEAIWFAGGDQNNYVSFFKNNALEDTLNSFINVKGGVIGGTSAGMAILGDAYFSAENGTVTNTTALNNPYDTTVTLGYNDFLDIPFLENVITDTHYDNPDRRARHSVFLARYATDNDTRAFGIACNEYTAVCIDHNGKAYVYGEYPIYDEYAYFIQSNCTSDFLPESCLPNEPLDWNRNSEALKVYRVPGVMTGTNSFDLNNWQSGSGGEWQSWFVDNGVFSESSTSNPNCNDVLSIGEVSIDNIIVSPNPFSEELKISTDLNNLTIELFDVKGQQMQVTILDHKIDTSNVSSGIYFLSIKSGALTKVFKLQKY